MKYAALIIILSLSVLLSAHDSSFAVTAAELSEKKHAFETNCSDITEALAKGEQIDLPRISDVAERERKNNCMIEFAVIRTLEKQLYQQQNQ